MVLTRLQWYRGRYCCGHKLVNAAATNGLPGIATGIPPHACTTKTDTPSTKTTPLLHAATQFHHITAKNSDVALLRACLPPVITLA